MGTLCACTHGEGVDSTELKWGKVNFRLPPSIEARGEDAAFLVRIHRAADGMVFLLDDLDMALWVRKNSGWNLLLNKVRIEKTFGGSFSFLPVTYFGKGFFAVAETVPGDIRERSHDGFPQALAVTFLLDSKDGKIKERTRPFVYDHNPRVKVPKSWMGRYQLEPETSVGNRWVIMEGSGMSKTGAGAAN